MGSLRGAAFAAAAAAAAAVAAGGCQSGECARYVACQRAFEEASELEPVDLARFEPGGACWWTLQGSQLCTSQCIGALDQFALVEPQEQLPAECRQPEPS